jgi:surface carbohydrate biosynthesis protein
LRIFNRQLRFGDPEPAEIVIFDEVGSQFIRRALNPDYSVTVFPSRPAEVRIGLRTIVFFLRDLSEFELTRLDRSRGVLRGVAKGVWLRLLAATISAMRPKAVLTFIDNSGNFHWLSKNCHRFPFIAVQNGSRLSYASDQAPDFYLQHFFCFGTHESELFEELGYCVEQFHPVGSLVSGLHFIPPTETVKEEYDLLVVSTWRGNIGYQKDVQDTMRSMLTMDQLLAQYLSARKLKAAVILRSERGSDDWLMPEVGNTEEEYYLGIYGSSIEIIDTDFTERNVFPLMQKSRLIVSCLSTALLEAYGIGKRILYCNFTGSDDYHRDKDSAITVSDETPSVFFERLDMLMDMSQLEYQRLHQERQEYYMSFPQGRSTHDAIARHVDSIIQSFQVGQCHPQEGDAGNGN